MKRLLRRTFSVVLLVAPPVLALVHAPSTSAAVIKIYWTSDDGIIRRADSDGSWVQELVSTNSPQTFGIALDVTAGKMYWTQQGSGINRANLDGTATESVVTGVPYPHDLALDPLSRKIYWQELASLEPPLTSAIRTLALDGSGGGTPVTGPGAFRGIALDVSGGKIYWTQEAPNMIQRANFDGSAIEPLVVPSSFPDGIALDLAAGKMYWSNELAQKILRSNLDGTGTEVYCTGLVGPEGIALDPVDGKAYWIDAAGQRIQRWNLDRTGDVETLVTTGVAGPRRIALWLCSPTTTRPPEVQGLHWTDRETLCWEPLSGCDTLYDVMRGNLEEVSYFGTGGDDSCLAEGTSATCTSDVLPNPVAGRGWFYLVRGSNAVGHGRYETASNGSDRATGVCD